MTESDNGCSEHERMIEVSKKFESAWIVYCHPRKYSPERLKEAILFLIDNKTKYLTVAALEPDRSDDFERVYMGLYHHPEIQEPFEIKYKFISN
jgi:hypothetical protein